MRLVGTETVLSDIELSNNETYVIDQKIQRIENIKLSGSSSLTINAATEQLGNILLLDSSLLVFPDGFVLRALTKYSTEEANKILSKHRVANKSQIDINLEKLLSLMRRDSDLTVEEAEMFRFSKARNVIPIQALLAFQLRHQDKLIFRDRVELEQAASEVFKRRVIAEDVLSGYRLYDEFRRKTGKTVAAALMQGTGHNEAIEFELKDRLDSILRNINKMDVLDLERAVMEVKGLELKKELGYGLSQREQAQILELKEHLRRARKELRQWAKRGFRENNTFLDWFLGREFHPQYKLPAKELILTREGRNYIKLLEKTAEGKYSQDESSLIQLEISKNLLLIAKDAQYRQNTLLQDENADKALGSLIEDTRQKGRTRDMNSGVPLEMAWMKLSELKLDNIQEGEVRTVPGMSVSLIKCAQQITEELVSDDNLQSINPPGKNKALEARRERLEKSHEKSLDKTLKSWISGYGTSRGKNRNIKQKS